MSGSINAKPAQADTHFSNTTESERSPPASAGMTAYNQAGNYGCCHASKDFRSGFPAFVLASKAGGAP